MKIKTLNILSVVLSLIGIGVIFWASCFTLDHFNVKIEGEAGEEKEVLILMMVLYFSITASLPLIYNIFIKLNKLN